jgi:hypothetical protein
MRLALSSVRLRRRAIRGRFDMRLQGAAESMLPGVFAVIDLFRFLDSTVACGFRAKKEKAARDGTSPSRKRDENEVGQVGQLQAC